jgi:mannitol-1-phosphate 5-dehydrogenase
VARQIVIWGAGKIGRGFAAEAFFSGGFDLVFVDSDAALVAELNRAGRYTLIKAAPEHEVVTLTIERYRAYHISETEAIAALVESVPYIAVAIFPAVFESLAGALSPGITKRAAVGKPLDIIVCANMRGAADRLRGLIDPRLDREARSFFTEKVGLVDTVIMRIAVPTPLRFAKYGALAVTTNGFPYMPIHTESFRGSVPKTPILRPTEEFEAEESRKLYTYNMAHAVLSYAGRMCGAKTVLDAAADPEVMEEVNAALGEISIALSAEFGFSDEQMSEWNRTVLMNLTNPLLEDTLERLAADPIRKLGRDDRLVGAALLCKRHGILPYYLTRAIARVFFYENRTDAGAERIQRDIKAKGIAATFRGVAELDKDPEIVSMVRSHFERLQAGGSVPTPEYVAFLRTAYERGFYHEQAVHGCAQCALASLFDVSGRKDAALFQAVSAMAGGVGLTGDGICGGYAAGILWMGSYVGRRLEHFDADKEEQYKSFDMAQRLRARYLDTYGSLICRDIHESIFDRAYILRTKEVRNQFDAAGGHVDRCTSVVAMAALWTTEILIEEGFLHPGREERGSPG